MLWQIQNYEKIQECNSIANSSNLKLPQLCNQTNLDVSDSPRACGIKDIAVEQPTENTTKRNARITKKKRKNTSLLDWIYYCVKHKKQFYFKVLH